MKLIRREKQLMFDEIKNNQKNKKFFNNIDLSNLEFRELDLLGIDFSKSNFRKSKFIKCNFTNVSFRAADLEYAYFNECIFRDTNLEFANIKKVNFENCGIWNADLRNSQGEGVIITKTNIENALLESSSFNYTNIRDCSCKEIKARGCLFENSIVYNSLFLNSDFTASNFCGAILKKDNFQFCSFTAVVAYGAEISETHFKKVDFFNADFRNVDSLSRDLREEIIKQSGLVSPQYFRLIWNSIYGKIAIIFSFFLLVLMIIENLVNPLFWSKDKIINQVQKARKRGNFKQAEAFLKTKLSRKITKDETGHLKLILADIYRDKGDIEKAKNLYKEILDMSGEWYSLEACSRIAGLYRQDNKIDEAINIYKWLIKIIPKEDTDRLNWVKLDLGDAYRDNGDIIEAEKIYKEVAGNQEVPVYRRIEGGLRIVDLLRRNNNDIEALNLCEDMLKEVKSKEQRGEIFLRIGDISCNSRQFEKARNIYEEILKSNIDSICLTTEVKKRLEFLKQ